MGICIQDAINSGKAQARPAPETHLLRLAPAPGARRWLWFRGCCPCIVPTPAACFPASPILAIAICSTNIN